MSLAMTIINGRVSVGTDIGWFPNTKPEFNVRKFDTMKIFYFLSPCSDVVQEIIKSRDSYGEVWGDSLGIYKITQDELEVLVFANADANASKQKIDNVELPSSNACPKCGSYCAGDCGALH